MGWRGRRKLPQTSDLPAEEITPAVLTLLEICHEQHEKIQALRDEIARLKVQKARPKIKPTKLEDGKQKKKKKKQEGRGRRGKRSNPSENDIREYVKKRKISGSTRSDEGRRCRDTFTSLKKTCRKHGLSFWAYLKDRVGAINAIPPLAELVPCPGARLLRLSRASRPMRNTTCATAAEPLLRRSLTTSAS